MVRVGGPATPSTPTLPGPPPAQPKPDPVNQSVMRAVSNRSTSYPPEDLTLKKQRAMSGEHPAKKSPRTMLLIFFYFFLNATGVMFTRARHSGYPLDNLQG